MEQYAHFYVHTWSYLTSSTYVLRAHDQQKGRKCAMHTLYYRVVNYFMQVWDSGLLHASKPLTHTCKSNLDNINGTTKQMGQDVYLFSSFAYFAMGSGYLKYLIR